MTLNETQKADAVGLLNQFVVNGKHVINRKHKYSIEEIDKKRTEALQIMKVILDSFFEKKIDVNDFKNKSQNFSGKYNFWGFNGFNGQLQLNQLFKLTSKLGELEELFRACLLLPTSKSEAFQIVRKYINVAPELVPFYKGFRRSSVPYFLSYFWQIQNPKFVPIPYPSSMMGLSAAKLIEANTDVTEQFINYWAVYDELAELFTAKPIVKNDIPYWLVEYVLSHQPMT